MAVPSGSRFTFSRTKPKTTSPMANPHAGVLGPPKSSIKLSYRPPPAMARSAPRHSWITKTVPV